MSKNQGKIFESQWEASVPDYVKIYRPPDQAQSFGDRSSSKKIRFSRKSPFDFLLWDSKNRLLYSLELKTKEGKSISFERTKEDSGDIHYYQIDELNKWNKFDGIISGLVIEFREIHKVVFIGIDEMNKLMEVIPKKSFCFDDLELYGIEYIPIGCTLLRTRYKYDIDGFLNDILKSKFYDF